MMICPVQAGQPEFPEKASDPALVLSMEFNFSADFTCGAV